MGPVAVISKELNGTSRGALKHVRQASSRVEVVGEKLKHPQLMVTGV